MTKYFDDAEVRIYEPGNTSIQREDADFIIADDLIMADLSNRASDYKGVGKFQIYNRNGRNTDAITSGNRIEFARSSGVGSEGYGVGGYGVGPYGTTVTRRWVGMVRSFEHDDMGQHNYMIAVDAEHFAPTIMSIRDCYDTFESQQIVGANGIVNEIINDNAPELKTSQLPDIPDTTSLFLRGQSVLEAVNSLAVRAGLIPVYSGKFVDMISPTEVTPEFEVIRSEDVGEIDTSIQDANLINNLRVEGGTGHDVESQSAQTTVNGYETITQTDRLFYQIQTRKSQLERVEVWTKTTGSGEDFTARLQKDQNGSPIAPADTKSDIVSRTLDPTFVDDDGFTGFLFGEHTLPEPFPWLILETSGPNGQQIGINTATGNPGVIPHFPYNVIITDISPESIETYRQRDGKISDDSLGTFSAARAKALEVLAKRDEPTVQIDVTAYSDRMHGLEPGNVVQVQHPPVKATGNFVVSETSEHYEDGQINTELTLEGFN